MTINKYKNIYFVGIGGIGMSALARYFNHLGKRVGGYDRTSSKLTNALKNEGIYITFDSDHTNIISPFDVKEQTLVVYTPAIAYTHPHMQYFRENGFEMMKRAQVLGLISDDKKAIGVAGTHGKTTVSTLVAHILKQSSLDCNAFLGGISNNYHSNFLLSKKSQWMVLEADEFDRSFLNLHPQIAVVTSMDADHLDIYGHKKELERTFHQYVSQVNAGGMLVYKKGLSLDLSQGIAYSYALDDMADFDGHNLRLEEGFYVFDLETPWGTIKDVKFSYPGRVNVENAVAASAVALLCGVQEDELRKALGCFKGVWRRFDYQIRTNSVVFIDDYAHHPSELKAIIMSVRELYPHKKITAVFQPHLYSRTRDFVDEFAQSLNLLDQLYLLDIYPAREKPIEGVTSQIILDRVTVPAQICSGDDLLTLLDNQKLEVLLTLGAGDINKLVDPLRVKLLEDIACGKK